MWLDRIKDRRKELNYTIKYISQEAKLPERTVSRIFAGETLSPCVDTLYSIAVVLDLSLDELLADSNSVVGSKHYSVLQEENVALVNEIETLNNQVALMSAELSVLKDKVGVLTAENGLLRLKLDHKEEIISLHNYYMKKLNDKNVEI